jgi:hypothetical protein
MGHDERISAPHELKSLSDRRARVLMIADSCFEVFTIRELMHQGSIRQEVLSSFTDSNESEIIEALSLALSWRRVLAESRGFPH